MSSEKQISANRTNATRSTGPRTSAGKPKVSRNALKHGLLAQQVVLPNEDEGEFAAFSLELERELRPLGALEEFFFSLIVASAWRLRRLMRVEKGLFIEYGYERLEFEARMRARDTSERSLSDLSTVQEIDVDIAILGAELERLRAIDEMEGDERHLAQVSEEQLKLAEERTAEAERRAERAGAFRDASDALFGAAFINDVQRIDAFTRLSRYEAHILRSMFKALDQLQHHQADRSQASVSGPASRELEVRDGDRSG